MKKLLLGLCLGALLGFGQTAETIPFRVVLSPKNELPAADLNASGTATLWVHILRDAGGQVVAGSVDFKVRYQFSGETTAEKGAGILPRHGHHKTLPQAQ